MPERLPLVDDTKETGRVEAFSDGVFAIAITLLILEIKVPLDLPFGSSLTSALFGQWPSFLAFFTSFATIGIMWINHHRLFTYIHKVDHTLMILNLLLLLSVTFVPYPTAVLAAYIDSPEGWIAAMFYSGTSVSIANLFNLLWRYAARPKLLNPRADMKAIEEITKNYRFGPLFYAVAAALAPFSVTASVGLNVALAVFFALPSRFNR